MGQVPCTDFENGFHNESLRLVGLATVMKTVLDFHGETRVTARHQHFLDCESLEYSLQWCTSEEGSLNRQARRRLWLDREHGAFRY